MAKTPFLEASYVSRVQDASDSLMINLYSEFIDTKTGRASGYLYQTPGLTLVASSGDNGPVRTMLSTPTTLYVVSANNVYSFDTSFNKTTLGTLNNSFGYAKFVKNYSQIGVFDSASSFLVGSTSLTPINTGFSPIGTVAYQDGFVLINQPGTNVIWQSQLQDMTMWPGLNFSSADGQEDTVVALIDVNREVWVLKDRTIEVWDDIGSSPFAFARNSGVFLEHGCIAPSSAVKIGPGLAWLGKNVEGGGQVFYSKGSYVPEIISTPALQYRWNQYPTLTDATAYSYQQEGHTFYVLSFPSGNETWVCDITETILTGVPQWHQRGAFSNGVYIRHNSNCYAYFNGMNLVGDYATGNIYKLDFSNGTDNGVQRRWLRRWQATKDGEDKARKFSQLTIDLTTGIGVPLTANPQIFLRWSDDGGYTWTSEIFRGAGQTGQTANRVQFKRLGSSSRLKGFCRTFEIASSDIFQVGLIGGYIS